MIFAGHCAGAQDIHIVGLVRNRRVGVARDGIPLEGYLRPVGGDINRIIEHRQHAIGAVGDTGVADMDEQKRNPQHRGVSNGLAVAAQPAFGIGGLGVAKSIFEAVGNRAGLAHDLLVRAARERGAAAVLDRDGARADGVCVGDGKFAGNRDIPAALDIVQRERCVTCDRKCGAGGQSAVYDGEFDIFKRQTAVHLFAVQVERNL